MSRWRRWCVALATLTLPAASPAAADPLGVLAVHLHRLDGTATCVPRTASDASDLRYNHRVLVDVTHTNIAYEWQPWAWAAAYGPCVASVRTTLTTRDASAFTSRTFVVESRSGTAPQYAYVTDVVEVPYYGPGGVRAMSTVDLTVRGEFLDHLTRKWVLFACYTDTYPVVASPAGPIFFTQPVLDQPCRGD